MANRKNGGGGCRLPQYPCGIFWKQICNVVMLYPLSMSNPRPHLTYNSPIEGVMLSFKIAIGAGIVAGDSGGFLPAMEIRCAGAFSRMKKKSSCLLSSHRVFAFICGIVFCYLWLPHLFADSYLLCPRAGRSHVYNRHLLQFHPQVVPGFRAGFRVAGDCLRLHAHGSHFADLSDQALPDCHYHYIYRGGDSHAPGARFPNTRWRSLCFSCTVSAFSFHLLPGGNDNGPRRTLRRVYPHLLPDPDIFRVKGDSQIRARGRQVHCEGSDRTPIHDPSRNGHHGDIGYLHRPALPADGADRRRFNFPGVEPKRLLREKYGAARKALTPEEKREIRKDRPFSVWIRRRWRRPAPY